MFESKRKNLATRLRALIDRFSAIRKRALEWQEEERFALRSGLGGHPHPALNEIVDKSDEQSGLCGEAITLLLVDRTLPFLLSRGVKRAEKFASGCEAYLDGLDEAAAYGRKMARERLGIEN